VAQPIMTWVIALLLWLINSTTQKSELCHKHAWFKQYSKFNETKFLTFTEWIVKRIFWIQQYLQKLIHQFGIQARLLN